jgi:hypothetical protein
MIELETPQQHEQPIPEPRIEEVSSEGNLSHFEVGPLQEGYGVTLGNALRRVLLSSLEGAAVTSVQITGVFQHEIQNAPPTPLAFAAPRIRTSASWRAMCFASWPSTGSICRQWWFGTRSQPHPPLSRAGP